MDAETHELIAAYALDALDDPTEVARIEELLATSEEAREELRAFSEATEALAVAASGPSPSPALRGRILADARNEAQTVVPFERPARRSRTTTVLAAAAGIAAAVALGLGLYALALSNDLDDTRAALSGERAVAAVLADPEAQTVDLAAGDGRLVVAPDGEAVLVAAGLAPAPSGKTYQVWIVDDTGATSAGLFPGSGGVDAVALEGPVDDGTVVAVTLETAGGAPQPTSDPLLASSRV